jgi:hypothetical protein
VRGFAADGIKSWANVQNGFPCWETWVAVSACNFAPVVSPMTNYFTMHQKRVTSDKQGKTANIKLLLSPTT